MHVLVTRILVPLVVLLLTAAPAHAKDLVLITPETVDTGGACYLDATPNAPIKVALRTDRADPPEQGRTVISPTSFDVTRTLDPGDTVICKLTVRNQRAKAVKFTIESLGITGSRSGGTKTVSQDSPDAAKSAASWIDPASDSITLKPMQIADIPLRVTVPPDPVRGGVFATVQAVAAITTPKGGAEPNVGVQVGAGVPLFLRVGGAGRPKLSFDDPRAPGLRVDRAAWTWRARVDNDGTQQAVPRGSVRITSIFGGTVAKFDLATQTLLPGGGERVQATWKRTPWIGLYKYDARVDPQGAKGGTSARDSGWIVVLPPWWMTIVAIVILLLAIAVPYIRKQREYRAYLGEVEDDLFDSGDEPPLPPRID